ncbi:MAG: SulP family inorganic anion transporter, partial [Clostridium sp.]
SRVQIGGPTGAFVVIVYGIIEQYGFEGLVISTIMAGIILIIFGLLKFGSLIKYICYPITVGFTAGIGVTLFVTQIKDFLGLNIDKVPSEFIPKISSYITNISGVNWIALLVGIVALAIIILWPKVNKTLPGSLIALIAVTVIVYLFKLDVPTIGSQFGEISSKLPSITIPSVKFETIVILMKPAFTIAVLAGIESLLSAVVSDSMIDDKHNSNMELVAQGIANVATGLFGGIPATGAIARTAANVKNGGRTPIAGIVHALTLLLIMKVFMPLAKFIPLSVLAAILMVVSYNMCEFKVFKKLLHANKSDVAILVATFLLTVVFDLVVAIEVGVIASMLLFMRKMAVSMEINKSKGREYVDENQEKLKKIGDKISVYDVKGPLFFGSVDVLSKDFSKIHKDTKVIILRMRHSRVIDATGYDTIYKLQEKLRKQGVLLIFSELHKEPRRLMENMGLIDKLGAKFFCNNFKEALNMALDEINLKIESKIS